MCFVFLFVLSLYVYLHGVPPVPPMPSWSTLAVSCSLNFIVVTYVRSSCCTVPNSNLETPCMSICTVVSHPHLCFCCSLRLPLSRSLFRLFSYVVSCLICLVFTTRPTTHPPRKPTTTQWMLQHHSCQIRCILKVVLLACHVDHGVRVYWTAYRSEACTIYGTSKIKPNPHTPEEGHGVATASIRQDKNMQHASS